jgi:hypothetical protein
VTEAEWVASNDSEPLLAFLRGKASDRKLRLFACGCRLRFAHLITLPAVREVCAVGERYIDGLATGKELATNAWTALRAFHQGPEDRSDLEVVYAAVRTVTTPEFHYASLPFLGFWDEVRDVSRWWQRIAARSAEPDILPYSEHEPEGEALAPEQ